VHTGLFVKRASAEEEAPYEVAIRSNQPTELHQRSGWAMRRDQGWKS